MSTTPQSARTRFAFGAGATAVLTFAAASLNVFGGLLNLEAVPTPTTGTPARPLPVSHDPQPATPAPEPAPPTPATSPTPATPPPTQPSPPPTQPTPPDPPLHPRGLSSEDVDALRATLDASSWTSARATYTQDAFGAHVLRLHVERANYPPLDLTESNLLPFDLFFHRSLEVLREALR